MPRTRQEARKAMQENVPKQPSTSIATGASTSSRGAKSKRLRPDPCADPVVGSSSTSDSSSQVSIDSSDGEVNSIGLKFDIVDPSVFSCPICTDPLTIPIFQCEGGHFSCESCCGKVRHKCPFCTKPTGNMRCSGMEKVIQSIKTTCKNAEHGCASKFSFAKKLNHENSCKYTRIPCPHVGCQFVGVGEHFFVHYLETHHESCCIIKYDCFNTVHVGEVPFLLMEVKTKRLFFLHRIIDPLGSFVCVSTAPTAPNKKFTYDIMAGSGGVSINMKSCVEITQIFFAKPAKEKCHLIPSNIHVGAENKGSIVTLELVIRKVRREQTAMSFVVCK